MRKRRPDRQTAEAVRLPLDLFYKIPRLGIGRPRTPRLAKRGRLLNGLRGAPRGDERLIKEVHHELVPGFLSNAFSSEGLLYSHLQQDEQTISALNLAVATAAFQVRETPPWDFFDLLTWHREVLENLDSEGNLHVTEQNRRRAQVYQSRDGRNPREARRSGSPMVALHAIGRLERQLEFEARLLGAMDEPGRFAMGLPGRAG